MSFDAPAMDYAGLSPVIALTVGVCVVLLSAVFKPVRRIAPFLSLLTLATTAGLLIWQWNDPQDLVAGALRLDDLAIAISLIAILTAAFAVLLSVREPAARHPRFRYPDDARRHRKAGSRQRHQVAPLSAHQRNDSRFALRE